MSERRDAIVRALKRAGTLNPTDDDIDTAANQFDYLCDPVTGTPRGSLDAVCDEAVKKGEEAKRNLEVRRVRGDFKKKGGKP